MAKKEVENSSKSVLSAETRLDEITPKEQLSEVYQWVDKFEFSRPKRNINRDFSDGVLVAELFNSICPKTAHLHNYSSSSSRKHKVDNWATLSHKIFRRFGFKLHPHDLEDIINAKPGAVEKLLFFFKQNLDRIKQRLGVRAERKPSIDETSNNKHVPFDSLQSSIEMYFDKVALIEELTETNEILLGKIRHLEQIIKLKDAKIRTLILKYSYPLETSE